MDPNGTAVDSTTVVPVEPRHAQRAISTLTLAFATDPPNRWLFPEPEQYLQHFPQFIRALGGAALSQGTALANRNFSAVALWLAPNEGPDDQAMAQLIEECVAPENKADIAAVIEEMGRYHPQEPHWYLPFIGVDPAQQGRGLGAMLLKVSLRRCDVAQLGAYLESTNPRNQSLYERHGFEAIGEIRVGSCPPVVPMLRRPVPGKAV